MTTYELPPEPEVGARVRDHHGHVWTHTNDGWSHPELRSSGLSWGAVMAYASPAELIEPDPWPTDDLIVATLSSPSRSTKRLLLARNSNGDYVDGVRSALQEIDTLTDVVPVQVVPVAEMRHAREMLAAADAGDFDSFIGSFRKLIAATDALGVSND